MRERRIDHGARLFRVEADQSGDRIQSVEKEVRIDLAGESFEPRLHQQPLLLFELGLVPGVVPDLERQRDAEIGGHVQTGQQRERIAPVDQRERGGPG